MEDESSSLSLSTIFTMKDLDKNLIDLVASYVAPTQEFNEDVLNNILEYLMSEGFVGKEIHPKTKEEAYFLRSEREIEEETLDMLNS